jgi:hypothetical protein
MKKDNKNHFISWQDFLDNPLYRSNINDKKDNNNHFISYQDYQKSLIKEKSNIDPGNSGPFISFEKYPETLKILKELPKLSEYHEDKDSDNPEMNKNLYTRKHIEINLKNTNIDFEQTLSLQKLAQMSYLALSTLPISTPPFSILPFPFSILSFFEKIPSIFDAISDDAESVNRIPLVPGRGFSDTKEEKNKFNQSHVDRHRNKKNQTHHYRG